MSNPLDGLRVEKPRRGGAVRRLKAEQASLTPKSSGGGGGGADRVIEPTRTALPPGSNRKRKNV